MIQLEGGYDRGQDYDVRRKWVGLQKSLLILHTQKEEEEGCDHAELMEVHS